MLTELGGDCFPLHLVRYHLSTENEKYINLPLHYQEKHQKSSLGVAEQSAPQLLPGTKSMQHAAGTRSTSPVLVLPVRSQMSSECFQIEPQAGKCPACTLRAAASSCSPRPRCPWHHAAARGRERHRTPDLLPLHPPPHQRRISCLCLSCTLLEQRESSEAALLLPDP